MEISATKKKHGKYCCAYGCREAPVKKKGGLCHKHYARKIRSTDPVYMRFNQWKSTSTQRGIENSVTLEQFRKFCQRAGYIVRKGMRGRNATIDRRCNVHGYHIWNLQLLSHRANARKGNRFSGNGFDCPFPDRITEDYELPF